MPIDNHENEIRTEACSFCTVCGTNGNLLYSGLRDRLFGSSGLWNVKRCANVHCGLMWLDPKPLPDEIWKAYTSYYTHTGSRIESKPGFLKGFYCSIKKSYIGTRYGYFENTAKRVPRYLGFLLYLFPVRRSEVDTEIRYLGAINGGLLLDVGCGSGDWLSLMSNMGWNVRGVDFDRSAVEFAVKSGLTVDVGTLEAQHYPENSFDAVALNHVMEHVPYPLALLKECYRVLKPGGTITLATPNSQSLGHSFFKADWRGLEPPRHLQVFTPAAMRETLKSAAFQNIEIRTYNSPYVWQQSYKLSRHQNMQLQGINVSWTATIRLAVLIFFEQCLISFKPSSGECVAALAKK